ncbi:MAG TPA: hypothetical protein VFV49_06335 [Thermoanaerobaculia bacterium]|nr:hypothetical protein [Thermoanaerobaculia bacterium]
MGRKKAKPEQEPFDHWAYYQSIQLTPEQKAAARAELQKKVDEASRNGVYEQIRALRGKVHLDMDDIREVRKSKR